MKPYLRKGISSFQKRLDYHYALKKGSWPNMAEIEPSALSKQCLDSRVANKEILAGEVDAWERKECNLSNSYMAVQ
jgi:hypothetical protein